MEKGDGPKVSFPANILECSICNEVTFKCSIILCKNNHITCLFCHKKLKEWSTENHNRDPKCGVCRAKFVDNPLANILIKNILETAEIECRFKKIGCSSKVPLFLREKHELDCQFRNICQFEKFGCNQFFSYPKPETLKAHEERCQYRIVKCMFGGYKCEVLINLGPMCSLLIGHFEKRHSDRGPVRRKTISNPTTFEVSGTGLMRGTTFFDHSGDVKYIFLSSCEIYDDFKACLISTTIIPSERYKWKCNISLEYKGEKIINYNGKIWSINDLQDLYGKLTWKLNDEDYCIKTRKMCEGGLLYDKQFGGFFNNKEITFKFDVWKHSK